MSNEERSADTKDEQEVLCGEKYTEKWGQSIRESCATREGERVGMESPVHGLRKVSHDVRHVTTFRALTSQSDSSGLQLRTWGAQEQWLGGRAGSQK